MKVTKTIFGAGVAVALMGSVAAQAADVVIGDLENPASVAEALQGMQAVYFICPNMHPQEFGIGEMMIH